MKPHIVGLFVLLVLRVEADPNSNIQTKRKLVKPSFITNQENSRWRRSTSGEFEMPEHLIFSIDVDSTTVTISLQLSFVNNANPPMLEYKSGSVIRVYTNNVERRAMYQDVNTGASYYVTCNGPSQEQCALHGSFYNQQNKYSMEPHSSFSSSGLHEIDELDDGEEFFDNDSLLPPESVRNENIRSEDEDIDDSDRSKRDVDDVNIVEFLVFADESVYEKFMNVTDSEEAALAAIQMYYALLVNEIDLHYLSVPLVDPSLRIRVALVGIVFVKSLEEFSWSKQNTRTILGTTYLNAQQAIHDLKTWRNVNRQKFPVHEHAMAFTMKNYEYVYDDNTTSNGLLGTAFLSQVCRSWDVSITQDEGSRAATIGAHELGHSLGARHDSSSTCPSRNYNIMAPSMRRTISSFLAENQWTFSSCSVSDFNRHIRMLRTNCMKEHTVDTSPFSDDAPETLPGEHYSLDQQCQMANGPESRSCVQIVPESGCYAGIRCDSGSCGFGSYYPHYPLAGSPCGSPGENKWCYKGKCVPRSTGEPQSSTPSTTTPISSPTPSSPSTTTTTSSTTTTTSSTTTTTSCNTSTTPSTTTTSTTTPSTTTAPTTTPTTTTKKPEVNYCKTRCCKKKGRRKKCCVGKRCCRKRWGKNMPCCVQCRLSG